jgi:cytochrome b involved in lipid metabolism
MNRKALSITFLIALLSVFTPANAAAPKAGATCSKVNQSQSASGNKFTCVKSGKKLVWKKVAAPATTAAPTSTPAPTPTASSTPAGYTMEQVKANNSSSKCWSVIDSKVYDLTNWINSHPGGSGAITALCGTDGTTAFKGQHGGSGQPASRLAGYLLGPLTK